MAQVTVTRERVTLDLLLYRRYGTDGQTLLEKAYWLNPGLADLGVFLPIGTLVDLPEAPTTEPASTRTVIDLFG